MLTLQILQFPHETLERCRPSLGEHLNPLKIHLRTKRKKNKIQKTCQSDFYIVSAWNCLGKGCFYSNKNCVQGHETESVRKNARKLTRSSLKHRREGKTDFFFQKNNFDGIVPFLEG